jgi:hypothetical protein
MGRGDHGRLAADQRAPASTLTSPEPVPAIKEGTPRARGTPAAGPPAGPSSYPGTKIQVTARPRHRSAPAINPDERSGLVLQPDFVTCGAGVLDTERPPLDDHDL